MSELSHLKERCAGCKQPGVPMNKEHLFPEWLIYRTKTNTTKVAWLSGKKIPALSATIPLCEKCNKEFGEELENPVKQVFDDLEAEIGISDHEAELLVRWLWKIKGLGWIANNPRGRYSLKGYSLRERVLLPIDQSRNQLVLAIALIANIQEEFGDMPMGIDSTTEYDANFVSGVFSRIAIMVVLTDFADMIPSQFRQYRLAAQRSELLSAKVFFPPTSFKDCVEAVGVTKIASGTLLNKHDQLAKSRLKLLTGLQD